MNKYLKICAIAAVVLVAGTVTYYLAMQTAQPPPTSLFDPRIPLHRTDLDFERYVSFIGDMELFYTFKTILSTINATLLIFLLITYIDMYKKLHSEFTIGLIIFSLILLLYALTANPLIHLLFGFRASGLGPFAMLPDLFTTLALAVLLYLTMK